MRPSFEDINGKLSAILVKYECKKVQLVKLNEMEKFMQMTESHNQFELHLANNMDNLPLPPPPPALSLPMPPALPQIPEKNALNNMNNVKITRKIINNNLNNDPKRAMSSVRSESEDSQYFSGADSSLLYADSSNFSSASSTSAYSNYSVPPPSMMEPSSIETPPSPPPIKSLAKLLNVASAAYKL